MSTPNPITLTAGEFRQLMPEFNDPGVYSQAIINMWLTVAANFFNTDRWGSLLNYGAQLFIAHHLVLGKRNQDTVANGGNPGELKGPLSSRTIDKVSSSYDTGAISLSDMGFWGLTTYGLELIQLYRQFGAGGLQLC